MMLPSAASSSMVPSDGLVLTPVTKLPSSGNGVLHGLLDAVGRPGDRRRPATPMVPFESPLSLQPDVVDVDVEPSCPWRRGSGCPRSRSRCWCSARSGAATGTAAPPNDTVALSWTTHSVAVATTSSARCGRTARHRAAQRATSATTMTTTRTIDSGSRNRFVILPSADGVLSAEVAGPGALRRVPAAEWGPCGIWPWQGCWPAGRAQGSVTPAILPYPAERSLSGCAAPRSCPATDCTASRSISVTSSSGRRPPRSTTSPSGRRHHAAADAGRPDRGDLVAGIGLADRGDEAAGVQRPGARQQRPLFELARPGAPRGVHGDQLRAAPRELDVELGEADVVAEGQPDARRIRRRPR